MRMTGTLLNVLGILAGGCAGLKWRAPLSEQRQTVLKVAMGVWLTWAGVSLLWRNVHGGFWAVAKQLLIVVLAMMAGRACGHLAGLQRLSNRAGHYARLRLAAAGVTPANRAGDSFLAATVLYCAAPLAWLGATQEGWNQNLAPLGVKALMDGLATMSFTGQYGWGPMLAALPVAALQTGIALGATRAAPFLQSHGLLESVNATSGLLVFSSALIVLGLRKVDLNNYLPALAFAPLITWLWR